MRNSFFFTIIFLLSNTIVAQTVKKEEYYDVLNTKIERTWYELGNGAQHGLETNYDEFGRVWLVREFDNDAVIQSILFFQDGEVNYEGNFLRGDVPNGKHNWFSYYDGNRFLKASANLLEGLVIDYKEYKKPDVLEFEYRNKDGIQEFITYDSKAEPSFKIKLQENKISGFGSGYKGSFSFEKNKVVNLQMGALKAQSKIDNLFSEQKDKGGIWKMVLAQKDLQFEFSGYFYSNWLTASTVNIMPP